MLPGRTRAGLSLLFLVGIFAFALALTVDAQRPGPPAGDKTIVVMLGTGNPAMDPDRSGPATAIVTNGAAYLVDFGPGVVRRVRSAVLARDIKALEPINIKVAFATHLHSDHTAGYADLILTPWVQRRPTSIDVYGPPGIVSMTAHLLEAYRVDIEARTSPDGTVGEANDGYKVNAHEVSPGIVYKDGNVTVTAFATMHVPQNFGDRFETRDRTIVISGDTSPVQATIDACNGCDVLIHEAISPAWAASLPEAASGLLRFAGRYHTTTPQLAELAIEAKPKLLVLYHYSSRTPEDLNAEMRSLYPGHFVVSRDLDVY